MFPNDARFICRCCKSRFYFSPSTFDAVTQSKQIACPQCGVTSKHPGDVARFFKFYPRLVKAQEGLKRAGFTLTDYTVVANSFCMIHINSLTLQCEACNSSVALPESKAFKLADEPGLLSCKKCRTAAAPLKAVKEFFVSYRVVSRAAFKLHTALWDVFDPLQLDPADYPVQWPVYRDAAEE